MLMMGAVMAAGFASAQVSPNSVTKIGAPPKVIWYQANIDSSAAGSARIKPVAVQAVMPNPIVVKTAAEARTQKANVAGVATSVAPIAPAVKIDDSTRSICESDINQDGTVDTRDFLAFLNAWASGNESADWNGDGEINLEDFNVFLSDWQSQRANGC